MSALAITSARPLGAKVLDSGRHVSPAAEVLRPPATQLGVGQFTLGGFINGGVQLIGPRGESCGVFVNEQLARATASHLNR